MNKIKAVKKEQSTLEPKWVHLSGPIADDAYLLIMQGGRYSINLRRRRMRRRKEATVSLNNRWAANEVTILGPVT